MKLSICTQLEEKNRNLDDWQAVVKRAADVKTKITRQAPLLAQESDSHCPHNQRYLKNKKSKN